MSERNEINPKDLLKPENMIMLYGQGAFPMADETGNINWYFPEDRTVIPLNKFNIPKSLKKFMQTSEFEYRYDTVTMEIVKNCAKRDTTWISKQLIKAYKGLLDSGYLHSVEVFLNNKLSGGLYGVTYRGAFFGESMFSLKPQASKCALVKLVERLNTKGFILLDVQYQTEHLKMFGAAEISLQEYNKLLLKSYKKNVFF